ncbi:MAG: carbohydrate kinase family protein [Angustibacter sp.]
MVVGLSLFEVVVRVDVDGSQRVERHVGGSPANVAIGLGRLGHDVALATCLGHDADGDLVRARLSDDGVRLVEGSASAARTSTATAHLDATGSASYEFDLVWDLLPVDVTSAGHVHTGSIAAALMPGSAAVSVALHGARAQGATTSYDPNLRPGIIGSADDERPAVEALVAASDVVKASEEDVAWLYSAHTVEEVGRLWLDLGPSLVVVTLGGEGAIAWHRGTPDQPIHVAPQRVQVVDTVGAGDSFMSGLLSGLLDAGLLGQGAREALRASAPDDVRPALERAVATSAITCSRAGSNPPTRPELDGARPAGL